MKFRKRFHYNKKRLFIYLFLFLSFCGVSVGYAFLNADLSISGAVKASKATWDVHFENLQITDGSSNSAYLPEADEGPSIIDDTTVSFQLGLDNPGEFYEFTIDVVNDGTIDAKIDSINILPVLTTEQSNYFNYTVTYYDGVEIQEGDALNSGVTEKLKIRFEYKKLDNHSLYPEDDADFDFSVDIDYVQGAGNEISHIRYMYTANLYNASIEGTNAVWLNQAFPATITQYGTFAEAIAALNSSGVGNSTWPLCLKHKIENGIVTESYVEFVVSDAMAAANTKMTAGTYTLKGLVYDHNKEILQTAFGSSNCSEFSNYFACYDSNSTLGASVYTFGYVGVRIGGNGGDECRIRSTGNSECGINGSGSGL